MKLDGKLKPISRTKLADEIFDQFVQLILDGEFAPGEKLPPERELANILGVGRSSVREALRALSAIGFLDARPGEGTFVTKSPAKFFSFPFILRNHFTKENFPEVMEARVVLEVKLAELATERGDEEEKELIVQSLDNMMSIKDDLDRSVTDSPHLREFIMQEDWHFHEAIAQAASNSYLFQMFLMIRYLLQQWMYQPPQRFTSYTLQEHQEIVDAIQAGDGCVPKPIDCGPDNNEIFLELYGTGIRGRSSLSAVTARIGGANAPVLYAGPVAGMTGLDQVNLGVSRSLIGRGEVNVELTVDGKAANTVKVNIK